MEDAEIKEKLHAWSLKPCDVFEDRIDFYEFNELNFLSTVSERDEIEKQGRSKVRHVYYKDISSIAYVRKFNTGKIILGPLDNKKKPEVIKYNVKGVRLGTNLASVLLDMAINKAKICLNNWKRDHVEETSFSNEKKKQ